MIARVLPPEEWPRLKGTEAEKLWPALNPASASVLVVEDEGEIVATWTLFPVMHAECLWAKSGYRGSINAAKKLLRLAKEIVDSVGAKSVITGSDSDHVCKLIKKFGGVPMPGLTYILPMDGLQRMQDRALGKAFHQRMQKQLIEELHPDDPEHNEAVGHALRLAIEERKPEQAMEEFNAFARSVGHGEVQFLGIVDGRMRADIGTAIIEVDEDYQVFVLEERAMKVGA